MLGLDGFYGCGATLAALDGNMPLGGRPSLCPPPDGEGFFCFRCVFGLGRHWLIWRGSRGGWGGLGRWGWGWFFLGGFYLGSGVGGRF